MVVHPDLNAVVNADRWVKVSTSRHTTNRRGALAVATVLLVVVSVAAMVVVRRLSDPETTPLGAVAQAILFRDAGLDLVWPQFLAVALVGNIFFALAIVRFRVITATSTA